MKDPLGTVERLKRGEDLGIPDLQVIAEVRLHFLLTLYSIINKIPDINWANYDVVVPDEGLKLLDNDITNDSGNNKTKTTHNTDDRTDTHNRVGDCVL